MKGLELSRKYFELCGMPMLRNSFPEVFPRIAAGLAGFGSECYGYDDDISVDHDFGPGFCLWLTDEDYLKSGKLIQAAYEKLPQEFLGLPARRESPGAEHRVGVFSVSGFYSLFLGPYQPPADSMQWFRIPEKNLAAATSGSVFLDGCGTFTHMRESLLAYYPRDVWLKKISVNLCIMAQSGQYNYNRCMQRDETVAARFALDEFLKGSVKLAHLLCREYTPFYKWAFRNLRKLHLPAQLTEKLQILAESDIANDSSKKNTHLIEEISDIFVQELHRRGLCACTSDFLFDYGKELLGILRDPYIRQMNIMEGQ